jgi:hypothetical protein
MLTKLQKMVEACCELFPGMRPHDAVAAAYEAWLITDEEWTAYHNRGR